MDCPEQGTRWSHSPFSWAASRDREGFPFSWEVELFGSLTHTQSQGLGIQTQLRAGIDVIGITAPLSKHRQCISLQKRFEHGMSLEFSVRKTISKEERRNILFQHGIGSCFNRNIFSKGLSASWTAQDLRSWEPPGSKSRNQEKNKPTSQPTKIISTTGVAKVNVVFNNYCCGLGLL